MELTLTPNLFENNRYVFSFGNYEVMFTIVDEQFQGSYNLGRINRINILARKFGTADTPGTARMCTTIIGMGDGVVGIQSGNPDLRGKVLNKDNMEQCRIILYEGW